MGHRPPAVRTGLAQQVQYQAHLWPAPRDVVLQKAVQLLVAQVKGRRQADEEHIKVEAAQTKAPGQPAQAQRVPLLLGDVDQFLRMVDGSRGSPGKGPFLGLVEVHHLPPIEAQGARQQPGHLRARSVQAPEGIRRVLAGLLPAPHLALQQNVDAGHLGLKIGHIQIERVGHLCLVPHRAAPS